MVAKYKVGTILNESHTTACIDTARPYSIQSLERATKYKESYHSVKFRIVYYEPKNENCPATNIVFKMQTMVPKDMIYCYNY